MRRVLVGCLVVGGLGLGGIAAAGGEVGPAASAEVDWKQKLSAEQYRILRNKGTERAFTGKYWNDFSQGVYTCGGCGLELFSADHKFDSGTGWPSYSAPIAEGRVITRPDFSHGMVRTEIACGGCGGHLGHLFEDGPAAQGGLRFCVNGNALDKIPAATPRPAKPGPATAP